LITDIVLGVQHGDEGKGKVTHHLLKNGNYTHCVRFNGGCNAGHTIYHNDKKFVTHHIPASVFFGIPAIIGPGCVVNIDKFLKELNYLSENGIEIDDQVKIARNAHIITRKHVTQDYRDKKIGTTKSGNGPAYRDKHDRKGVRAENVPLLAPFIVDMYEELYNNDNAVVLMEGAQGFWLDVDWGDYPYVTSSNCGVGSVINNGIDPRSIRDIWGVAKVYETYVGNKKFQPNSQIFNEIQKAGSEFGATTGRTRQCNWLDFGQLTKAIKMNGVNKLVLNKVDVLRNVRRWGIKNPDALFSDGEDGFVKFVTENMPECVEEIFFSSCPKTI
jgi:adenylosuccinate synthase